MANNLKKSYLQSIAKEVKFAVFGYVHEIQKQNPTHFNIPELISYLLVAYFAIKADKFSKGSYDYFIGDDGTKCERAENEDADDEIGKPIHYMENAMISTYPARFFWKLKLEMGGLGFPFSNPAFILSGYKDGKETKEIRHNCDGKFSALSRRRNSDARTFYYGDEITICLDLFQGKLKIKINDAEFVKIQDIPIQKGLVYKLGVEMELSDDILRLTQHKIEYHQ